MKRILAVLALVFSSTFAHAQVDRAALTGTVKDTTNAVIPNATVTITGPQAPQTTRTNSDGVYQILSLIPGRYVVEAEFTGFQKGTRTVILDVGQKGNVDFTLGVGASETVSVEAKRLLEA